MAAMRYFSATIMATGVVYYLASDQVGRLMAKYSLSSPAMSPMAGTFEVSAVRPGSRLAKFGVKVEDRIISIGEESYNEPLAWMNALREFEKVEIGPTTIKVFRQEEGSWERVDLVPAE